MIEKYMELHYMGMDNSPYQLSKALSEFFFEQIKLIVNKDEERQVLMLYAMFETASENLIPKKEYRLTKNQISKFLVKFKNNIPMIIFSYYVQTIRDNEDEMNSVDINRAIVYKLIVNAHNEFIPLADKKMSAILNEDLYCDMMDILYGKPFPR